MDNYTFLKPKLTRLKLSGILETITVRMGQAVDEKWSYSTFLDMLLSDEVERRAQKQLVCRLGKSELELEQTLETFDFSFNLKIHKPTIMELANCFFIEKKENIFFLGPSGVGKTHLAQGIGHEACRKGYEVIFRDTCKLLSWLRAGKGDGSHERRMNFVTTVSLLIIDDFGLHPLIEEKQIDLYEIISARYGKQSTIIMSNRDFNEWPMVFSNPLMGSAAMDRLVHRANKIVIEGKSYRLDSFVKRTLKQIKETGSAPVEQNEQKIGENVDKQCQVM